MPLLEEVGTYLQTSAIGTLGTDIFLSTLPDQPDVAVVVYTYPGEAPASTLGGETLPAYDLPRIQVVTRATTYSAAATKADTIWRLLTKVTDRTLSGVRYLRIEAINGPAPLRRDDQDRELIFANYQVWREIT